MVVTGTVVVSMSGRVGVTVSAGVVVSADTRGGCKEQNLTVMLRIKGDTFIIQPPGVCLRVPAM